MWTVDEWLDRLAGALGVEEITPPEMSMALQIARDVAHGIERKLAPVSTFLVGVSVGVRTAQGGSREEALRRAVAATRAIIPREGGPADEPTR